jgi:hypothetical protein
VSLQSKCNGNYDSIQLLNADVAAMKAKIQSLDTSTVEHMLVWVKTVRSALYYVYVYGHDNSNSFSNLRSDLYALKLFYPL